MSGDVGLPDDYVGYALVGQIDGHGSKHVIWVNNASGSRAAAWPPDDIVKDETWATAEPVYMTADLTAHDARIASEAAERALREAADRMCDPYAGEPFQPFHAQWLVARADRLAAEREDRS